MPFPQHKSSIHARAPQPARAGVNAVGRAVPAARKSRAIPGGHSPPYETIPFGCCELLPQPARSGISLMEVLIAVFVVSIGLLGIAALIPVANFALIETSKADRSAACGQAAMRDVRVRRLLELVPDATAPLLLNGNTIVVDPLGFANGDTRPLFASLLARNRLYTQARLRDPVNYSTWMLPDEAERIFFSRDDLLFDMGEDTSRRPTGFAAHGNAPVPQRSYSWLFTISSASSEDLAAQQLGWDGRKRFTVSVAVCHGRDFTSHERPFSIAPNGVFGVRDTVTGDMRGLIAGIQMLVPRSETRPTLDAGQWVVVCGNAPSGAKIAEWYRLAAAAEVDDPSDLDNYKYYLAVDGPAWPSPLVPNYVVIIPGVLGVYTTSVELDRSPEWMR